MKKYITIFLILLYLLIQSNCSKNDSSNNVPMPEKIGSIWKGLGKSYEKPEGTPYVLPAGIKLAGKINGYSEFDCACRKKTDSCFLGTGFSVRVCIGFTNSTNVPIKFSIPPGLIFISNDIKFQNGLITELLEFEIPPMQTTYFSIGAHCLNLSRDLPTMNDDYIIGPITQNPYLIEIMRIAGKKVIKNIDDAALIQGAVWEITDDDKNDDFFKKQLEALENK